MAASIGKIKGAKVVGIAGEPDKVKYLTDEIGVDYAYDYKSSGWKEAFVKEVGLVYVFLQLTYQHWTLTLLTVTCISTTVSSTWLLLI